MMKPARKSQLNFRLLASVVLIGLVYSGLLFFHVRLTGDNHIDGTLGVLFSLYVSSHPAANVLDLLFFARGTLKQGLSDEAYAGWWALNILALLTGWFGIFVSLIRFTTPS
jgi:hypothetical protein